MGQARLKSTRLELVPLADEHLPYEIELDSDPEVLRYLSPGAHTPEEVERSHRSRLARSLEVDGLGVWMGFDGDAFVGMWMLQPPHGPSQPKEPGAADLGYRLLRRHGVRATPARARWSSSATVSRISGCTGSSPRRWR